LLLQDGAEAASSGAELAEAQSWALEFARGLAAVPRFDMAAMSIGAKDKKELGAAWAAAFGPGEVQTQLRARFKL
jgi:hypothetical protein